MENLLRELLERMRSDGKDTVSFQDYEAKEQVVVKRTKL